MDWRQSFAFAYQITTVGNSLWPTTTAAVRLVMTGVEVSNRAGGAHRGHWSNRGRRAKRYAFFGRRPHMYVPGDAPLLVRASPVSGAHVWALRAPRVRIERKEMRCHGGPCSCSWDLRLFGCDAMGLDLDRDPRSLVASLPPLVLTWPPIEIPILAPAHCRAD